VADRIPVLSIWRPWPTLILSHGKDVENRGWTTNHRGPLWIHAAKRWDDDGWYAARQRGIYISARPTTHPTGIVGLVQLTDVCSALAVPYQRDLPQTCDCGGWAAHGQHHWRLTNPRPITAIPCRGRQGLWWPTGELAEQLQEAVSHG
jgi:ASCH domain